MIPWALLRCAARAMLPSRKAETRDRWIEYANRHTGRG